MSDTEGAFFVKNSKGVLRFVDGLGFVYHKDRISNDKFYWRCKNRINCRARALTSGNAIVHLTGQHPHEPPVLDISEDEVKYPARYEPKRRTTRPPILAAATTTTNAQNPSTSTATAPAGTYFLLESADGSMCSPPPSNVVDCSPTQLYQDMLSVRSTPTPPLLPIPILGKVKPRLPQNVCLQWNTFQDNIQRTYPDLLSSEKFVDVSLSCEGQTIKAHKLVLSSCSSYFDSVLTDVPVTQHPILLLPRDIYYWQVKSLIDFMYTGQITIREDQLTEFMRAAEYLEVKGLVNPKRTNIENVEVTPEAFSLLCDEDYPDLKPEPIKPAKRKRKSPVRPRNEDASMFVTHSPSVSITKINKDPSKKQRTDERRTQSPGIEITPFFQYHNTKPGSSHSINDPDNGPSSNDSVTLEDDSGTNGNTTAAANTGDHFILTDPFAENDNQDTKNFQFEGDENSRNPSSNEFISSDDIQIINNS